MPGAADLDREGRVEFVLAVGRQDRSTLQVYRWRGGELYPVGKTLVVAGTGELLSPGLNLATLRTQDGKRLSCTILGWKEGGLVVRAGLKSLSAGTALAPVAQEGLELLVAGTNGPQSLLRIE